MIGVSLSFSDGFSFTVRSHFVANLDRFALRDIPLENESPFLNLDRVLTAAGFWWTDDSKQSILERISFEVRRLVLLVFWRIWRWIELKLDDEEDSSSDSSEGIERICARSSESSELYAEY